MKSVTYKAFPSIPVIFVSGVRKNSMTPIHNTMGMAVTDVKEQTRTETKVTLTEKPGIEFWLDRKKIDLAKQNPLNKVIGFFTRKLGQRGLKIESRNYNIYSGSSDSGMAALVFALNDLMKTRYALQKLAEIAMLGSESSIRSVYGGISAILVKGLRKAKGKLIAPADQLRDIHLFALTFDYSSRYSAKEIFAINQSNPQFKYRLAMIHFWENQIMRGLKNKNYWQVFKAVQENVFNAHYLFECSGKRMRRKDMTNACIDVDEIRLEKDLPAFWTAGGGKVITVISWGTNAQKVRKELMKRGWKPKDYKIAPGPVKIK